jgi:flagellin FlaB
MNGKLSKWFKDESGITALETAIILIAFVVVAAIFAFSVLTTGTFLTERSKEAAYSGLQEVRGSMELKGSVVLSSISQAGDSLVFNLANVAGGSSQDLSKARITFRTSTKNIELTNKVVTTEGATYVAPGAGEWASANLETPSTGLKIVTSGTIAKITVNLGSNTISPNDQFALEVKPQTGGVLLIERTAPAQITAVTDLH